MNKKLILAVMTLMPPAALTAQEEVDSMAVAVQNEQAFIFTEEQLDENDNATHNVTILSSNHNIYANDVGYRFSPARFKYRAYGSRYTDVHINGNPVNDAERGEFRYSFVGGLNNQTRSQESSLPFEPNTFSMAAMGGSENYNFRPSSFATGQTASIAGANRNYNTRLMYTYNTGVQENGWAFTASMTYRCGNGTGYVEGTSYNSLSYFLGAEKKLNSQHALSLVTWGNPTERGMQAASTDEMYWIANDRMYNPVWGYQDGKKRNSRIVKDYEPAAMLTWDWSIDRQTKLTTTLLGKYAMYSSSRLDYNNTTNPAPDYYSSLPSSYMHVWDEGYYDNVSTEVYLSDKANWQTAYDYLSAAKANRQVQWDRLYYANHQVALQGGEAMYFVKRLHDDQLSLSLASYLDKQLANNSNLYAGLQLSTNKGMHYQTMDDMLGATTYHNVNNFNIKEYGRNSEKIQFDLNDPDRLVNEGDRYGYDYNVFVNKAQLWAGYTKNLNRAHVFVNGRVAGTTMQREGKMRNGLAPDNSYGRGKTARFLDGGGKAGLHYNLGQGHAFLIGAGYELKTPSARTALQAAQINNDFVRGLKNEKVFSAEVDYQLKTSLLKLNVNAYYSQLNDVTEQSMYYIDGDGYQSFAFVTVSGIKKEYYGVEVGANLKLTDWLNLKALGTVSEAKYVNDADYAYTLDKDGRTNYDRVLTKGIREGNTPLSAFSLDLAYHAQGWYIDLIGNYYDRIYLYYSSVTRRESQFPFNNDGTTRDRSSIPDQAKGHGGFMLDASIGKQFYLKHGRRLGINLMLTNILNNMDIVTGGREQSRIDAQEKPRAYTFQYSPYKFYANGINGMLMLNYHF